MLPQYEITTILGRGGMGAVYKGRQVKLNRDVAIKLLPETLAEGDDEMNFVARFEQEAQAMANLDHPAIVSVYDFGETETGQCYFVMEFIDGMDIHQYLKANGGQLSQEHALAIASHVLDALEYAHSHGIVHRDIKPANVLLNQEGRVKIADFGLAKKIVDEGDESPGLTMSNVALGTPDFVAPESIDGSRVPDHRADLYAVGVMLYQMLTGTLPRGQFKTPSEHRPELDFRLDEIVSRAMQTDPDDRYGSATAIRTDLDLIANAPVTKVEVIEDEEKAPAAVPKKTITPPKKSKVGLWTSVAVGAVVVAVLALVLLPAQGDKVETAAPAPVAVEPDPVVAEVEKPTPPPAKIEPVAKAKEEKADPPAPTAVAEVPKVVEQEAKPEPVVEEKPIVAEAMAEPTEAPFISELKIRLNGYLKARQKAVLDLAVKYEGALSARTNTAADAGDLPLVKSFRAEAKLVADLKKELAANDGNLTARVNSTATLPDLAAGAPPGLAQLRETWTNERAKISNTLDAQLRQSLVAAEKQLTKAREFDKAEVILTFRQTLGAPPAPQTPGEPEPAPVQTADANTAGTENPFGWKPIPSDPFPLPIPKRQTTPCRVVAFRMDGKPVDEAAFREGFGGVPDDMGEVVDFAGYPSISPGSESKYFTFKPVGLRIDGTCVAMQWNSVVETVQDQLTDVVAMDMGRFSFAALRGDGTVVAACLNKGAMDKLNINYDEVSSWKDIARISAGDYDVGGVTVSGEPRLAGGNADGKRDIPEGLEMDILDVDVNNSSGVSDLLQKTRDGYRFVKFGQRDAEMVFGKDERHFDHELPMVADSRGRLLKDAMPLDAPHKLVELGRNNLRDVILMVRAQTVHYPSGMGITAVCEKNDRWTFWGNTEEVGGFDPDYCAERAEGAWKLFPMYPYVLALKPVSKLTPEDWTGAGAAIPAPPAPKTASPAAAKAQFPLPIPGRPTAAGHVIVIRRDGKPLDPATDHAATTLPEELDSDVVQISVSGGTTGKLDDAIFAAALFDDGKVRMWGGQRDFPEFAEDFAENRKMRISEIVQVSAGSWSYLFLDDKGRVHGTGGGIGINWNNGIEKIPTPGTTVDLHSRLGDRAALLDTGETVIIAKEKSQYEGILKKIPRSIAMASVFGGVSLGDDLVWRSWLSKTPSEVTAEFPSEGLIGKPSALNSQLMWIGADGKVRANFIDTGVEPNNFSLLPKSLEAVENATAVHIGTSLKAIGNASGEWFFNDDVNDLESELSAQVKGAIAIESTYDYIFALMPGERTK